MATFKICVRKQRRDGLFPVYIRITHNRKTGSSEQCNDMLGLGEIETNYLTDFNFFLYCNKTRKFYTSIVYYNGYHWPGLGKSEWEINEEIGQVYCFTDLIQAGMDFVQANSYMFNQYKKSEVLEKMVEKWQYS